MSVDLYGVAAVITAASAGFATLRTGRKVDTTSKKVDVVQDTVNGSALVKERRIEQLTDALTTAEVAVPMHQPPDPPHEPGTGT